MTGQYYHQLLPSNQVSITLLCKCHFELKCKTLHRPLVALTSLVWVLRRESPAPPGWLLRPPCSAVTEYMVYELMAQRGLWGQGDMGFDLGLISDQLAL